MSAESAIDNHQRRGNVAKPNTLAESENVMSKKNRIAKNVNGSKIASKKSGLFVTAYGRHVETAKARAMALRAIIEIDVQEARNVAKTLRERAKAAIAAKAEHDAKAKADALANAKAMLLGQSPLGATAGNSDVASFLRAQATSPSRKIAHHALSALCLASIGETAPLHSLVGEEHANALMTAQKQRDKLGLSIALKSATGRADLNGIRQTLLRLAKEANVGLKADTFYRVSL